MAPTLTFVAHLPRQSGSRWIGFASGASLRGSQSKSTAGYARFSRHRGRGLASFPARRHVGTVMVAIPALPSVINPTVLRSSIMAISKLMVTLLFGVVAAKRGLLDTPTMSALSKTVYAIFLPALLLTNVVRTLSGGSATTLFWLPLAAVVQVAIGLAVGVFGSSLLRLNDSERRIFIVCSGFGNSAALPLLFANALFDGAPGQLAGLISSISFFIVGWTGLFWSIGYSILAGIQNPHAVAGTVSANDSNGTSFFLATVRRILSPPLVAALTGLAIGLVAPVRTVFVSSPAFSALQTLGTGYSPAAVLILAGSLARKVDMSDKTRVDSGSVIRLRRVSLGICICRFLLMPILGLFLVRRGSALFTTPLVKYAILLEAIMPPAQNSTLILNLVKKPDAAANVARILLVVYLIGVIPVSIGLTYFLGFAGV